MPTPEPGTTDQRKLRPWQFSLRSLLILTGGVALLLGICQSRALEPVLQFCTIGVLFFQFYVLLLLAAGRCFPQGWGLARGVTASAVLAAYFMFGDKYFDPPNRSAEVVLLSASWLSWPSLAAMGWLIRRAATEEDRQSLRRVSLMHLAAEISCLAVVVLTAWLQGIEILWFHDDHLWLLAFLANGIPLVLWVSLFSPWRKVPQRAWPDSLFRWCMIVALGIAIPSCLAMLYLSLNRERLDEYYSSRGEYTLFWFEITAVLVFNLPQLVSAVLFVAGVTCQLFRAHQDRLLIALGCVYFIPFWLALLIAPRLLH